MEEILTHEKWNAEYGGSLKKYIAAKIQNNIFLSSRPCPSTFIFEWKYSQKVKINR